MLAKRIISVVVGTVSVIGLSTTAYTMFSSDPTKAQAQTAEDELIESNPNGLIVPILPKFCTGHCVLIGDKLTPVPDLNNGRSQCDTGQTGKKCKIDQNACNDKKEDDRVIGVCQ